MDPNETFAIWKAGFLPENFGRDNAMIKQWVAAENLLEWLDRGGFAPRWVESDKIFFERWCCAKGLRSCTWALEVGDPVVHALYSHVDGVITRVDRDASFFPYYVAWADGRLNTAGGFGSNAFDFSRMAAKTLGVVHKDWDFA